MIIALLLSVSVAFATDPDAGPSEDVFQEYQTLAAGAGRDAEAHVQVALWCEARGMTPERTRHLTRAVLIDPENSVARGLLAMVARDGKWARPEQVRSELENDAPARALLDEYLRRRAESADTADAHLDLARWCERNGLDEQASAHYKAVVRLEPGREVIWKRLGYKKSGGRWMRAEDVAAEKARAEARRLADRRWKPVLEKLRDQFTDKDEQVRRKASDALDAISDPLAVPSIWSVFVRDDARLQRRAAETFARIDGRAASLALAELAVFSPLAGVRGLASDLLDRRDPRDYLDPLLAMIQKPFKYSVRPIVASGSQGGLFVEGDEYDVQRVYSLPAVDPTRVPRRIFTDDIPLQTGFPPALLGRAILFPTSQAPNARPISINLPGGGVSVLTAAGAGAPAPIADPLIQEAIRRDQQIARDALEDQNRIDQARRRMVEDVATIERLNGEIRNVNDRVLPLVKAATGEDFGGDREAWKSWWSDQLGYAYRSSRPETKPVYSDLLTFDAPRQTGTSSCFAVGTPVHTMFGLQPIEEVRVGDLVLSQDVTTGAVAFKPVLVIHHNPPAETLKLTLGSETVESTGIHRFWVPGKGWTMARDLKPGDSVRALGEVRVVAAVEPGGRQPVYNLDVADNLNFLVGRAGFLVHDFSIVEEPARPFDAIAAPDAQAMALR